jgi:hypothetical protein
MARYRKQILTSRTDTEDIEMIEHLRTELAETTAELNVHLHSWEYAFAMGSSCHGATNHPVLHAARAKTARLERRRGDLLARLAEHE